MPRRPLLQGAVFFVLPIILIDMFGFKAAVLTGVLMMIITVMISKQKECQRRMVLCIVFFVCGSMNWTVHYLISDPLKDFVGSTEDLRGRVITCSYKQIGNEPQDQLQQSAVVRVDKYNRRILLKTYGDGDKKIMPGDYISFRGQVTSPDKRANPACFDYSRYLEAKGIHVIVNGDDYRIIDKKSLFVRKIFIKRDEFIKRLEINASGETAAAVLGILFGDSSRMEEETVTEFQKNGTAHVLAVSGLHVGIIYAFICFLWPWTKEKCFALFIVVFLLIYSMMASFAVSVLRASIMIFLHLLAKLTNRRYDLSSAAFAIVILMVIINPMSIYDVSMQMSFLAVLTMSLITPYVKRIHDGILSGSIAVQAGLMPYIMYVFNYLPLGAFLVNIPIIMITGIIVPLGLISMITYMLNDCLFDITSEMLNLLCTGLIKFNSATCIDGVTALGVKSPPEFFVVLFYGTLLTLLSEEGRIGIIRKGKKYVLTVIILLLSVSLLFNMGTLTGFEKVSLTFVNVGQGDCIHLKTEGGKNYLIDGGGSENYNVGNKIIRPYLLKNGISHIDGAFVTHLHTDHYKGIKELCQLGMIDRLYVYESNRIWEDRILQETGLDKEQINYVYGGMIIRIDKQNSVRVIMPERKTISEYENIEADEKNENDKSLIVVLNASGVSTLIAGDADSECENRLIDKRGVSIDVDILKVSHHGSRFSSSEEFLRAIKAEYAVIQVGKNNYGHPAPEVLEKLNERGTAVYRNDIHGAVGFIIERGKIRDVITMR